MRTWAARSWIVMRSLRSGRRWLRVGLAIAVVGCGSSGSERPPDAAAATGVTALFELPRAGVGPGEFYELPFPNDVRVRDDGTIDLETHVRSSVAVEPYLALASVAGGFGTQQAIFFRFDAAIDADTLPADALASLDPAASVYLVDVDPGSPRRGIRAPLLFRFTARVGASIGPNRLSCLPFPGVPLRASTTYAVVVTRRLLASDGTPVDRSADFAALAGAGGDEAVAAARAIYEPLFTWLDEPGGDERDDVVSAAVFTTQDPTSLVGRAREVVHRDVAPPAAEEVFLLETNPTHRLYAGRYPAPSFQRGEPPYSSTGGDIVVDASGDPVVQRTESIRFAVAYPAGAPPPTGWPVVLVAHGTGGDYLSFRDQGLAEVLASAGLASMSIDAVLHGDRAPPGTDPSTTFFNPSNPPAMRDNVRQSAIDNFQLVRLVQSLEPPDADAILDPDRILFVGHSQGGITGTPFVAHEPLLRGAVISAAGGPFYLVLVHKQLPVNLRELLGLVFGDDSLDEHSNLLALMQMGQEPADPAIYAPLVVPGGRDVLAIEGIGDLWVPNGTTEALAVSLGAAPVEPILSPADGFALVGIAPVAAPVSANAGGRTAVLLQDGPAPDHDPHFVLFDNADTRARAIEFLSTLASDGVATLPP